MRMLIKLILYKLGFIKLVDFAQIIHDGFVAQVADYGTPPITMADFQTDIDTLRAAKLKWGTKGNRGSHADYLATVSADTVVRDDLRQLANYAQTARPDNPESWAKVGFEAKKPKGPPQFLAIVQSLRWMKSEKLMSGDIKLGWKRPLDTDPGDVKGYLVQFNNIDVPPELKGSRGVVNVWGIVTSASIVITPPYAGANYFWVTPFNAAGFGKTSDGMLYNAPGKL
jgi:hypothetical protein